MPSRARQGVTVLKRKNGESKGTIILMRRTGYIDVWVNGQHFYYNSKQQNIDPKKINWEELERKARESGKKGVIVIRRK